MAGGKEMGDSSSFGQRGHSGNVNDQKWRRASKEYRTDQKNAWSYNFEDTKVRKGVVIAKQRNNKKGVEETET